MVGKAWGFPTKILLVQGGAAEMKKKQGLGEEIPESWRPVEFSRCYGN